MPKLKMEAQPRMRKVRRATIMVLTSIGSAF